MRKYLILTITLFILFFTVSCLYAQTGNELVQKGYAELQKKNYSGALEYFNKFIEQNPGRAVGYNARGTTYFLMKLLEPAIVDFNKAIELDSNY